MDLLDALRDIFDPVLETVNQLIDALGRTFEPVQETVNRVIDALWRLIDTCASKRRERPRGRRGKDAPRTARAVAAVEHVPVAAAMRKCTAATGE